jgi:hypothetical protein
MTEKQLQLVTFEQAVRLKKSGFDWETEEYYYSDGTAGASICCNYNADKGHFSAPTVALAFKWFRDEKGKCFEIRKAEWDGGIKKLGWEYYTHKLCDIPSRIYSSYESIFYYTYEAAESALLDELLRLVESIKNNN